MWSEILVIVCFLAAIVILIVQSGAKYWQIKLFLTVVLLSVVASFTTSMIFTEYETIVTEWAKITAIAFLLTVLAILIRYLKPSYTRYPALFSYTPLLLLPAYPFISDAGVIKDLMNVILQGGAILIAFLLFISLANKFQKLFTYLSGLLLFLVSYAIYWFAPEVADENSWIWHLPVAIAVILISYKISEVVRRLN